MGTCATKFQTEAQQQSINALSLQRTTSNNGTVVSQTTDSEINKKSKSHNHHVQFLLIMGYIRIYLETFSNLIIQWISNE